MNADALAHALILSGITVDLIDISGVAPPTLATAISTVLEAAALTVTGPPVSGLATLAYYLRVGSIAAVVTADSQLPFVRGVTNLCVAGKEVVTNGGGRDGEDLR